MIYKSYLLFVTILTLTQLTYGQQTCTSQGRQCSADCSKVLFCPSGTGEQAIELATCPTDETCDDTTFSCSANGSCNTGGTTSLPVVCFENGRIPDLYNCSNYYSCSSPGDAPESVCTCATGQIFDHQTKTCRTTTTCVPIQANPCTAVGACAAIPYDTTNYYAYICVTQNGVTFPEIYNCIGAFDGSSCSCAGRFMFEPADSKVDTCVPYVPPATSPPGTDTTPDPDTSSTTTQDPATSSTTTQDPATSSTTTQDPDTSSTTDLTSTTSGETEPTCTYSGQTFPAQDCTKFWLCYADLTAHLRSCLKGDHFDAALQACVFGPC